MKKATSKPAASGSEPTASDLIDARIKELNDWRGATLAQVRAHVIGLALQSGIIIDCHAAMHLHGRPDPPLRLLHHVPSFVWKMPLLPRRHMNIATLGVSVRIQLRGPVLRITEICRNIVVLKATGNCGRLSTASGRLSSAARLGMQNSASALLPHCRNLSSN